MVDALGAARYLDQLWRKPPSKVNALREPSSRVFQDRAQQSENYPQLVAETLALNRAGDHLIGTWP